MVRTFFSGWAIYNGKPLIIRQLLASYDPLRGLIPQTIATPISKRQNKLLLVVGLQQVEQQQAAMQRAITEGRLRGRLSRRAGVACDCLPRRRFVARTDGAGLYCCSRSQPSEYDGLWLALGILNLPPEEKAM